MADFKISRIRYTWRNAWVTGTAYNRDDVVRYGANSYVCMIQHTAQANFNDDIAYVPPGESSVTPRWRKMTDGYVYRRAWTTPTLYNVNDVVDYGGNLYRCNTAHTSSDFESDVANWTLHLDAIDWKGEWQENTTYGKGDIVRYNGIVYECITGHTAQSFSTGLEADISKWQIVHENVEYREAWTNDRVYRLNDLVKYGGTIYRCNTFHTSASNFDQTKWDVEFYGFNFREDWDPDEYYGIGDIVRHGGFVYYCNKAHTNQYPSDTQLGVAEYWSQLARATRFLGDWDPDTIYRAGDLVRRGGQLWIAINLTSSDGSSLDYLDDSAWELVITGSDWKNFWTQGNTYSVGDLVLFDGSTYRANTEHIADTQNYPGDNGSGYFYWDLIIQSGDNVGMTAGGDLLTFNLSRRFAGDGSTFETTNVPIGSPDQVLNIDNEDTLYYKFWGDTQQFIYVDPTGVDDDDPERGVNPFKPYRTVRYACEKIEDQQYAGTSTVYLSAGHFNEILPIVVPARTAITGTEVRTTVVQPNVANINELANVAYRGLLSHLSGKLPGMFSGSVVSKSEGNTETQVIPTRSTSRVVPDPLGGEDIIVIDTENIIAGASAIDHIQDVIGDMVQYIQYNVNSDGQDITITGSNDITDEEDYVNAQTILTANIDFLIAEAKAWLALEYPNDSYNDEELTKILKKTLRAWVYDLKYIGNYKSVREAQYVANSQLGSKGKDMFYVRDATGIRNLTVQGLEGTLAPPSIFDLYQRPTGGSYVSLDAGWGPNDEKVWITTRSCYVQNVTTFGYAVTGQKIDGALHNGGNKSIVSNDFTQVISDGIGAHVLNNGRAELVSVFTYYAQVGYLAEDGGVIRATNGNCSYGTYGALATGIDGAEVPRSATVNNRNQHAIVSDAFAGEVNDEIIALQYTNAGQNYTSANFSFVGSGTQAAVIGDEIRDNAIFNVRIINEARQPFDTIVPDGSFVVGFDYEILVAGDTQWTAYGAPNSDVGTQFRATAVGDPDGTGTAYYVPPLASAGGTGFILVGNNAQAGNSTTITIASNDENEEAQLLGVRIILTSGTGTGQYGYVKAYNPVTKLVTVYKESDDTPGWDHVIGGYPILPILDTSSTYRFEPRPIFDDPGFTPSEQSFGVSTSWTNIVYGETTETYNVQSTQIGTGEVVEDDGLVPTAASFLVTRQGRFYTVTLDDGGAGYVAGDTVTISGDNLGGTTPDNDITIEVLTTSDDSTDSVLTFSYEGVGISGKFIATATTGTTALYSSDGVTWDNGVLPSSGNWKVIGAGNNKFVAVQNGSNVAATSEDGVTWTSRTVTASSAWNDIVYGNGIWVVVSGEDNRAIYSKNDGETWKNANIPSFGDSTLNEWVSVAWGKNKFVALANSNNVVAVGEYDADADTLTWDVRILDVIDDSTQVDWKEIAFGNDRFVALSETGNLAYSFDGVTWYARDMIKPDGSTIMNWTSINYGQGLFFATCNTGGRQVFGDNTTGPTQICATSPDGYNWTVKELSNSQNWKKAVFGNPDLLLGDSTLRNNSPMWIVIPEDIIARYNRVYTGARAQGRCLVESGRISAVKIWEPGSGYYTTPGLTIIDPNNTSELFVENRIGDGVLAQPTWLNRGVGYKTSTTRVTVTGDGFADVIPVDKFVTLSDLSRYPGPGTQLLFAGNDEVYTVITITELGDLGDVGGNLSATFRISPTLEIDDNLQHATTVTIRERYSQCRITGHDFLDIGTGNFDDTNYPTLYATGDFVSAPENEIVEADGGRVFYTATDQSGNFRCGELFQVEQATGIVTLSADFFELDGLNELALGGVRLGGTGAVIREFSTDPLFTADSNNVVPTQRAIKAYLAGRLSVGGAELTTASFIAGTVKVGPDGINSTISGVINFPGLVRFDGTSDGVSGYDGKGEVSGAIVAQTMFHASFDDDPIRTS